jgi:hypothetical protein
MLSPCHAQIFKVPNLPYLDKCILLLVVPQTAIAYQEMKRRSTLPTFSFVNFVFINQLALLCCTQVQQHVIFYFRN